MLCPSGVNDKAGGTPICPALKGTSPDKRVGRVQRRMSGRATRPRGCAGRLMPLAKIAERRSDPIEN